MNITKLKGKWNIAQGRLKQQTGGLMQNKLLLDEGKKQELYGKFQVKMSRKKVRFTVI
jgi:uncharacterized protein YjbJ (UPF0337 family)